MKTCLIKVKLSSEQSADSTSVVNICDDCVFSDRRQDSPLVTRLEEEYEPAHGETCKWCGITAEEEAQAWAE